MPAAPVMTVTLGPLTIPPVTVSKTSRCTASRPMSGDAHVEAVEKSATQQRDRCLRVPFGGCCKTQHVHIEALFTLPSGFSGQNTPVR